MRKALFYLALVSSLGAAACEQKQQGSPGASEILASEALWDRVGSSEYRLKLTSITTLGALPAGQALDLRAALHATFGRDGSKRKVVVRLGHVELIGVPAEAGATLIQELEQSFGAELEAGSVAHYFDPPGASPIAYGIRRQLLALFQGEAAPKETTAGSEWDATGLAAIEMRRTGPQDATWRKLRYERVLVDERQKGALPPDWKPQIESSNGTLKWDENGVIRLTREERIGAELTPGSRILTSTAIVLERTQSPESGGGSAGLAVLPSLTMSEPGVAPRQELATLDAARVGDRKFDDVVRELKSQKAAPSADPKQVLQNEHRDYEALVGLFRTEPTNIDRAVRLIRQEDPLKDLLVRALGTASSQGTLRALEELALNEKVKWPLRERAAFSLIRAERPTPEALEGLLRIERIERLRETAILGLGTFVRRYREASEVKAAEKGAAQLRSWLASAVSVQDQTRVLLAIANAGSPELYPDVVAYQDVKDPKVRDAAVQAIRLMPLPVVEPRLVELLQKSGGADLISVLRALAKRTEVERSTALLVQDYLKGGWAPDVRREAAVALLTWRNHYPEVMSRLRELASEDEDPRVREVAREAEHG